MFSRKAKKAASNAPRVTDDEELPSGEQHSRVVQPEAAETSSSSPTGVTSEACERSGSSSSSSTSGGVDATRANSATTTTPAAGATTPRAPSRARRARWAARCGSAKFSLRSRRALRLADFVAGFGAVVAVPRRLWVRFDAAVSAALTRNCCCFYDNACLPSCAQPRLAFPRVAGVVYHLRVTLRPPFG